MYDMNFFSVYKKRRAKSKGLKIFLAVLIIVLLLVNAGIIGGGLWLFNTLEDEIQEKEDWINDPATKEAIAEAEKLNEEVRLTGEYSDLLVGANQELMMMDVISSDLFDKIRELTPLGTKFTSASYSNNSINLSCISSVLTDAMDMYSACKRSNLFSQVNMSGFSVDQNGGVSFSISLLLKGGVNQ